MLMSPEAISKISRPEVRRASGFAAKPVDIENGIFPRYRVEVPYHGERTIELLLASNRFPNRGFDEREGVVWSSGYPESGVHSIDVSFFRQRDIAHLLESGVGIIGRSGYQDLNVAELLSIGLHYPTFQIADSIMACGQQVMMGKLGYLRLGFNVKPGVYHHELKYPIHPDCLVAAKKMRLSIP